MKDYLDAVRKKLKCRFFIWSKERRGIFYLYDEDETYRAVGPSHSETFQL
jgi:hypothetical protein